LVTHCMPAMPDEVTLQYAGLVALDNGRAKQRIHGSIGMPLQWDVQDDFILFSVLITTKRLPNSLAKCTVAGREIYVNVGLVDGDRGVDRKLPELGSKTIRDILTKLEG